MLVRESLLVFLVASANVSCTQAENGQVENGNRRPINSGIVVNQSNNTYYVKPGTTVYGSIISQHNVHSSNDGSDDVQSRTVVISNGNQPTQVYVERSGEPDKMYVVPAGPPKPAPQYAAQQASQQVPYRGPQYQQFPVYQQSPYDYTQQFNLLKNKMLEMERTLNEIKGYLNRIAPAIWNLINRKK